MDNVTFCVDREIELRAGRTFFSRLIIFRITNPLNLKRLQLQILLVLAREPLNIMFFSLQTYNNIKLIMIDLLRLKENF